jgi:hypothetical protein
MNELLNSTALADGCVADTSAAEVSIPVTTPEPDLSSLPRRVDRKKAAELVTHFVFPTSPRALEDWELDWIIIAGRATCDTANLFAMAQQKLAAGRRVKRRSTDPPLSSHPTRPLAA